MQTEKRNTLEKNKIWNLKMIQIIILAVTVLVMVFDYLEIIELPTIQKNKRELEDCYVIKYQN